MWVDLAASGITDAAQPLLDELAQARGELVCLAVIEGDQARVEETRQRGYAVVFRGPISAMAVVIRRERGAEPVGTLSIAGPSISVTRERLDVLAPAGLDCARRLALVSVSWPVFGRR